MSGGLWSLLQEPQYLFPEFNRRSMSPLPLHEKAESLMQQLNTLANRSSERSVGVHPPEGSNPNTAKEWCRT